MNWSRCAVRPQEGCQYAVRVQCNLASISRRDCVSSSKRTHRHRDVRYSRDICTLCVRFVTKKGMSPAVSAVRSVAAKDACVWDSVYVCESVQLRPHGYP